MADRLRAFGIELRRIRMEAGLSLAELGDRLHYSKGHLSKIETGRKSPSVELARRCDAELDARGALISLIAEKPSEVLPSEGTTDEDGVWLMNLSSMDTSWFRPVDRRDALAMTASSPAGFALSTQGLSATAKEPTALEVFRSLFDQFRNLGQTASPGVVLPPVIAQTHVLRSLAARAPTGVRDELLVLAARFAEYAGWMAQESGDDAGALWWTAQAVAMAEAGQDRDLAVYALIRRALVTLYRDDATQTIELAREAQVRPGVPRRIRGLAAQREAQGHALGGDYDACLRSLDRARELLSSAEDAPGVSALGPTNLTDPVSMVTGWCLYELGRPKEASPILDAEVARIQPQALRSRARYGVRQALAHAAAGEVDHACELTGELLSITDVVSSATIATDLRRLARVLSRWHQHPPVRELFPALTASLQTSKV
ncbi:helix-turn-helix domain-containing protein [Actinomadura sp. DC4]|uniref:helix-turn-helix domain-containing protein n=1 Tax=Actinomadura sp. DC4 TaxID=3055069 RepID=UPI0025B183C0|nr:helix-turn-helix domain-containing protein [Actinomadura sp. DC4]MDN3351699.1 helix-turn-helix domain-containing protein [Actinomadura sp. DC4]